MSDVLKPEALVVADERFVTHTPPPGHPEAPARAEVFDVIADAWRAAGGAVAAPRPATRDELARVHTAQHLDAIAATRGRAVMLDPDTFTSPESADVAALAAGAGLVALDWVLGDVGQGANAAGVPGARLRRALALVRPPGHHAEADKAMGFCLYNNIAVVAAAARARGLSRVAVVDVDVHHGNGTQHSFARDPHVLFVSTHQYPFYPGTGAASEIGEGPGRGFTVNVPLGAGCTDGDYALVFERVVTPVLDEFAPELVLISAGVDAHVDDPLAHMRMTPAGFAHVTRAIAGVADRHAGGRVVALTEGGYDLPALRASLEAVLGVLSGRAADEGAALAGATGRGATAVASVRAALAGHWDALS
jgi:acetoin utilization deacetylase AcuC-like enzyme